MITRRSILKNLLISWSIVLLCIPLTAQEKRLGRHTVSEWHALIDSLWGPGPPTSTKLQIFDSFWDLIDREYAGFPNLNLNWDSVKALYRPEIEAGVSRGRLSAITGQLILSLQEIHTFIVDSGIDNAGYYSQNNVYVPGTPLFWPTGWGPCGVFGAALTPLPDSSLLVYKAIVPHPLGIVPGDVILGYDGSPWKQLYKEIVSAQFPMGAWGEGRWGSSSRSMAHSLLGSAGNNWGFFDTVDVVKYATGDTIHLPTVSLAGLGWDSLFATEQVPVQGVQMPNYATGECVTYGVLDNTSIGYIYVYRWNTSEGPLFAAALRDLVTVRKVTGLILDFRYNLGSADSHSAADAGLDYLFNENPAGPLRWREAMRMTGADHLSFTYRAPFDQNVIMTPDYYDRPIAVLTGPQAWSMGDHTPFRMRFHPMVRLFGLPTNGAFVVPGSQPFFGPSWESWYYGRAGGQMQSLVNDEGFLMHEGFPVDEEVWLTRDGVANGEDDVVKRAVEWITTLTHAHDANVSAPYCGGGVDSTGVTAMLTNPANHISALSAIVTDAAGAVCDSLLMFNDGTHGDLRPGDSIWSCVIRAPLGEDCYSVAIRTDDVTNGTFRRLPNAALFTTAGPVTCVGDTSSQNPSWGLSVMFRLKVANGGSTRTIPGVSGAIRALDTAATILTGSFSVGDLAPGVMRMGSAIRMSFSPWCTGLRDIPFDVAFSSGGTVYWRDTIRIRVTDPVGLAQEQEVPTAFQLHQSYPNPFNPSTTIRYGLPNHSHVQLSVFNTLGQQVATLIEGEQEAGYYEVRFDASGLASGVYLYRLQAGHFVLAKKLVLLR